MRRFKNWATTIIGALMMLLGVSMYVTNKYFHQEFTWVEITLTIVIGWVFLRAKDTLIEGILFGLLKIKKPLTEEKAPLLCDEYKQKEELYEQL